MKDLLKEFKSYATSENKISPLVLDKQIRDINNVLTPYILEEREMRMTQMDVFSRLLKDRIIWLSGVVDQYMCDVVQAQLMFLDSVDNKDITMHINSPGGSVISGIGIIDVMNYIKSDVATINTGLRCFYGCSFIYLLVQKVKDPHLFIQRL